MNTAENFLETYVNGVLFRVSSNFKGSIKAADKNIILVLVLSRYHT
jgi:hypothetical protein